MNEKICCDLEAQLQSEIFENARILEEIITTNNLWNKNETYILKNGKKIFREELDAIIEMK